jgi:hypothetical protein
MKMPEVEYLLAYEELDKHYIVFEKNSETMLVEPIIRFVCEKQAHEYFERLGFELIHPRDADWGDDTPKLNW